MTQENPPKPDKTHNLRWQSDVIVDLVKQYDFPYITLNPGASFRGLHDSLVNYGGNEPPMLLCQHEEIAVLIAHGYAKASRKPMVAIVHNLVGLLHANLAIYYAYVDRVPIFIIGATGPMDESKRRPHIDWTHTANVQGEAVRHYTKWDYQPAAIDGVPESFMRAYSVMMTEPQGPIYMCYDALLQELPLERDIPLPPADAVKVPTPIAPDPTVLEKVAERLLAAERPVLMAEFVGRSETGFDDLVALAETVGAPVWDINSRLNFPNRHPLNLSLDQGVFTDADVIVGLDVRDWEKPTSKLDGINRVTTSIVPDDCEWIEIGFGELGISKWSMDYRRLQHCSHRLLADTATAIPALTELCRGRVAADPALAAKIEARAEAIGKRHAALRATWLEQAREGWDDSPLTLPRLASEVWEVIKDEDWVLTAGTLQQWARRLWDFDRPYRHAGKSLGTATQIGISMGVALAHKGTGRLVVDLQPDGDLMFDAGSLWVAAKHQIPMLVVMFNNRSYYNDWEHQLRMARQRGTPEERAHIGMDLYGPEPDFAGLARSMGWHGEGPIENGDDVAPALVRAIAEVKAGRPALVDTVTQHR
jgi:acetolactate synthase-1/2/3 large subunit